MKYIQAISIFFALLTGCASVSTQVSSFVALDHADEKYSRPVVWGRIAPPGDRMLLEDSIVTSFSSKGIKPVPGTEAFPLGRKITGEDIFPALQKSVGDSLLIVSLKPGASLYHMEYEATLYGDRAQKVWVGNIVTRLQQADITDDETDKLIFKSTADELVNKIMQDGIIQ